MTEVAQQRPGALATGMNQDLQRRRVPERGVRAKDQPLGPRHGPAVRGQAEDGVPVAGVGAGPVGEHLVRADGVQLFHAVEQPERRCCGRRGRGRSHADSVRGPEKEDEWQESLHPQGCCHTDVVHHLVALALPEVVAFDLAIPAQIFGHPDERGRYAFATCSPAPGLVPSTTGFAVHVEAGLEALTGTDTVVVSGFAPLDPPDEPVLDALRAAAERGARWSTSTPTSSTSTRAR
jgi:hypothetical protein